MTLIYETDNFIAETDLPPHITRTDGGHIKVSPKKRVRNRQDLPPGLEVEFIWFTTVLGDAMTNAMNKRGVDIGIINYQDNGNWSVFDKKGSYFHMHLYGRAKSAKIQKYGEALTLPNIKEYPEFYKNNKPLNKGDITEIRKEIKKLLKTDKYSFRRWKL